MVRQKVEKIKTGGVKEYKRVNFSSIVLFGLILLALSAFIFYFVKYQKAKQQIIYLSSFEGRQEIENKAVDSVINQVKKHIILPVGETPTLATIEDADVLAKDQPFFADAKNGDRVLIYSDRAFVYRPSTDLLVNVGPVYFPDQSVTSEESN